MNAGLEDIRILFEFFDKHTSRTEALAEYSKYRKEDAHVINDLALQNYVEMRASVVSPIYSARKWLEESLSVHVPSLGWQTKYSRVSFGNERYSEVVRKSERQGKIIFASLIGLVSSPVVIGAGLLLYRWYEARRTTKSLLKWQGWFGWLST